MKVRKLTQTGALALLLLSVVNVARAQDIRVGLVTVTSGAAISPEIAAAQTAAQDAGKVLGANIVVMPEDGSCTDEATASVIRKFKGAGALVILGSFCGPGIAAAARLAKELETPIISVRPVPAERLKEGFPWFFSEVSRPGRWAIALASELERLGVSELNVLYWSNEYGKAGLSGFDSWSKQKKLKLASQVSFPVSPVDFRQYWTLTKKADGLAFVASPEVAAKGIQESIQAGLDPRLIAVVSIPNPDFFLMTQVIAKPMIFPILYPPDLEKTRRFFARLGTVSPQAQFLQSIYRIKDTFDMLAIAVRAKGRTSRGIQESFQAFTSPYADGLAARIRIDRSSNEWLQEFYVGEWSKGTYKTAGGPKNHERGP